MPLLNPIKVGARASNLSKAQVGEVLQEIKVFHPEIDFETVFMQSHGDLNKQASLRTLEKTDFFTREIDECLLSHQCDIAIHSAKDLPFPLREGLEVIAITKGKDPSDSLVIKPGFDLDTLPKKALIGTSSFRREELLKQMRSDFTFIDIRGTIEERLSLLSTAKVDGVVIAEAALIRLGLTHLNRLKIPGETVPGQGKLAILGRRHDLAMHSIFKVLDSR